MVLVNLALVGDDHVAVAIDQRLAERIWVLIRRDIVAELLDLGPNKNGVAIRVHAVDVVVEDVTVLVELAGLDQAGGDVSIGIFFTGFKVDAEARLERPRSVAAMAEAELTENFMF